MTNPFSTEFVRPGAIEYEFDSGSLAETISKWRKSGEVGQVLGPHGSGKSTLLHALAKELSGQGEFVELIQYRRSSGIFTPIKIKSTLFKTYGFEGELSDNLAAQASKPDQLKTILMIDGFEQLNPLRRLLFLKANRRPLFVTVHREVKNVPLLLEVVPAIGRLETLVSDLLSNAESPEHLITIDDVALAYENSKGNFREAFFELYDVFHRRQSQTSPSLEYFASERAPRNLQLRKC